MGRVEGAANLGAQRRTSPLTRRRAASGPGRIRVLVAEDDAVVRDALAALVRSDPALELAGEAADADGAIALAARERPDVALIDVRMPGGGANAARGIKLRSPATRVLALSAHDDRTTVLEMFQAGIVGYLVKGTSIVSIVEGIERAAEGQTSLSVEVSGNVLEELVNHLESVRRESERRDRHVQRIRRVLSERELIEMVFMPICDLRSRTAIGAEALARFRCSPRRGPERWFFEAAGVGRRIDLELAAIRNALELVGELPPGVFLSVNASPETISSARFRRVVGSAPPEGLVVELTEHAPIKDYDALNAAFAPVRALGVRLAIDDAGAGFASLRHILRLAPEFIKLDLSLVRGIHANRSQQALAAGLIAFAEKIEATIVAEGIEDDADREALYGLGVGYGQGYLFAQPAPLPLPGSLPGPAANRRPA